MNLLTVVLSWTKILMAFSANIIVFYHGVKLFRKHSESRIRVFSLGLILGELAVGLIFIFPETILIFHLDPNHVNSVLSVSLGLSILLLTMTAVFYPNEPRRALLIIMLMCVMIGTLMGSWLSRMIHGEPPFYLILLTGDASRHGTREWIEGTILIIGSLVSLLLIFSKIRTRCQIFSEIPIEISTILFSLAEIGTGTGVFFFGLALISGNELLIVMFQLAAALTLIALAALSLSTTGSQPIPFTSYLCLKRDLLAPNSTLGWVFYIFGRLGPEPYLECTTCLQDLSEKEKIEFIMEMGVKSMSLMTFGDRFARTSIKIHIQEPFEGMIFYLGGLGRTETMVNEFDERFDGRPYVGLLVISREKEHSWIFDKTSLWESRFQELCERHAIEEMSLKTINDELLRLFYSLIAE